MVPAIDRADSVAAAASLDRLGPVSRPGAQVPVLVVQPREELQLCRDTVAAIGR